jgi:hypothetical protein
MVDASWYLALPKNPCKINQPFNPTSGNYPNYWKNLGNAFFFASPAPPAQSDAQWMAQIDRRYSGMIVTVRADSSAKSIPSTKVVNDAPRVGYKESIWDPLKQGCQ